MKPANEQGDIPRRVLSSGSLKGNTVTNPEGQDLGKIEDIMLDHASGRVAYAVLSFGGFMGVGDKLFAIPWDALDVDQRDERFILNVDKEVLEQAPGFDKNNWPDFADPQWGQRIHDHYGTTPYWEQETRTQRPRM